MKGTILISFHFISDVLSMREINHLNATVMIVIFPCNARVFFNAKEYSETRKNILQHEENFLRHEGNILQYEGIIVE